MATTIWAFLLAVFVSTIYLAECNQRACLNDRYRPQIHYSQAAHWINDPNGMVFYKGEYHLFYQYHPYSTVWGPMHWGHAISTDLVHWEELPIALYPDELGAIFSGSAVVDSRNTSGLQQHLDEDVIVALFTHHSDSAVQQQSIAFSNDRGRNFQKFSGNPVLPNPPGVIDFRDPKVIEVDGKWVMALAVGNKIEFYGCEDLMSWSKLSEFGADPPQGSHGGVWECPDLFPLDFDGQTVWVLLVSINPGGPNLGSVTQYFLGDFDGLTFRSYYPGESPVLWMDWGPDNYAGVTFSNEPNNKRVLMGWMQNWLYSSGIPTEVWRGQMTIPRELVIKMVEGRLRLASIPVPEMELLRNPDEVYSPPNIGVISSGSIVVLTSGMPFTNHLLELDLSLQFDGFASFGICFYNGLAQELCFGYEHANSQFFLDRSRSGNVNFHPEFSRRATAVRESRNKNITFKVFLDDSSIEIFADGGTTVMTALFYPDQPYSFAHVHHYAGDSVLEIQSATLRGLHSIYDC